MAVPCAAFSMRFRDKCDGIMIDSPACKRSPSASFSTRVLHTRRNCISCLYFARPPLWNAICRRAVSERLETTPRALRLRVVWCIYNG